MKVRQRLYLQEWEGEGGLGWDEKGVINASVEVNVYDFT